MDLERFYKLLVHDQQQYFGKTYIQIQSNEGPYVWGYCDSFLTENEIAFLRESKERAIRVDLKMNPPNFDFPESGLYNFGVSTVYLQRIPKRQSKKGFCQDTASFRAFEDLFVEPKRKQRIIPRERKEIWRVTSIKEMFEDLKDFSLADSMIHFKKLRPISFAVNRNFGLSLGIRSKYLSLWYKQILVGEAVSPKELLVYKDSLFKQEVLDHFVPENVRVTCEE